MQNIHVLRILIQLSSINKKLWGDLSIARRFKTQNMMGLGDIEMMKITNIKTKVMVKG
jgi:hypothetical protein